MKYISILGLRNYSTSCPVESVEFKVGCLKCGYPVSNVDKHKFCPNCGHEYTRKIPTNVNRDKLVDMMNASLENGTEN